MDKITVISLTTISSRVARLAPVIESLLLQQKAQTRYYIKIYISTEPYMLDEGISDIPHDLYTLAEQHRDKVEICYTRNIGPYRKFIPILESYRNNEIYFDYLVTADDDTIYPSDWLRGLVLGIQQHDCVVAYRGRQLMFKNFRIAPYLTWRYSIDELLFPDIRTVGIGKDGIIYRPCFFHPAVMNIEKALALCGHTDDLWLKIHTALLGVPSVLLQQDLAAEFPDFSKDDTTTLYHRFNEMGGNDSAMSALEKYTLQEFGVSLYDVFREHVSPCSTWVSEKFIKTLV